MDRRGFLKLLAGAGVAAATNPVHFLAPIGGWKSDVIVNPHQQPGRIDFLNLENWARLEPAPLDFYEFNGQTLFPVYKPDGGIAVQYLRFSRPAPPPYRVSFSGKLIGTEKKRIRRVFTI